MKKNWTAFLIIICIGLTGCGGKDNEDALEVSSLSGVEQEDDIITDETGSDAEDENIVIDDIVDTNEAADNVAQMDTDNSNANEDTDEKTKEAKLPEYEVTPLEESIVMYASTAVNVRKGPSTDFEIIGSLNRGRDVTVTGQADTGWYEILYNEETAFVSNSYLQNEAPEEEPVPESTPEQELSAAPEATPEQETQSESEATSEQEPPAAPDNQTQETAEINPVTEVKNVAGVILVGDSRFVQMQSSVGDNSCTWIAEGGKGYKWFNEKAIARIDSCVGKGSKILINLGVNDPGNIQNYLALVNAKAEEWTVKGATVYYASVNPVWENPYVTEERVESFNSQLQNGLSGNVHFIDSHSYLTSIGYKLVDGLHYSSETYQNLYAYYMSCL